MSGRSTQASDNVHQICRDLANEVHKIEEIAHNMSLSAVNNTPNATLPSNISNASDEEMDIAYDSDLLATLDKEMQQICVRLACIIDSIGPVFPRSEDHAIQGYFMKLAEEIKSMKLGNEKNNQQKKGFRDRIRLLQLQKNSLERAVNGAQKRLAAEVEESKRADELLQRIHVDFAATRKDLALTAAHDSKDPEKWTDVSPFLNSHVELLLRDMIIEFNPTDSKLARFTI